MAGEVGKAGQAVDAFGPWMQQEGSGNPRRCYRGAAGGEVAGCHDSTVCDPGGTLDYHIMRDPRREIRGDRPWEVPHAQG